VVERFRLLRRFILTNGFVDMTVPLTQRRTSLMTVHAAVEAMKLIAEGSRILYEQGVLDAFGHLSCRSPVRSDSFFISRNLAPAMVTAEDVVELDLDCTIISGPADTRLFLERFIHAEIYRRRPDVQAIVHSHATAVLPFTLVKTARLRPVCHVCGFLEGVPPPFDVADHAGPSTDLLIRNAALGRQLADHLGNANVVLMRAHGYTAVGCSVQQAVYRAVYTIKNCQIDLSSRMLGEPTFLTAGEAAACETTTGEQVRRAWELWVQQASSGSFRTH
jgi:ribulose-5-phosphate 4-epimerase/fuculose-1-phosphate aldolase